MLERKKRTEVTSADKQQLGFEFQYLLFMSRLLSMGPGEEVGYEKLDDIHCVSSKGITSFIQVKHTIRLSANGDLTALTKYSIDLWKSLSNWAKLIKDPAEGRKSIANQQEFIDASEFVLVVNRKIHNNPFIQLIQEAVDNKTTGAQIKKKLKDYSLSTTDITVKSYIDDVETLSSRVLLCYLKKLRILSIDSIEEEIKLQIKSKMIPDLFIDDVYKSLYSQLKSDFFKDVKCGKHQVLSFDEWTKKYSSVFREYRTTLLPIREFETTLPEHLEDQCFVKELIEIGAIDLKEDGLAEIAEFTRCYLTVQLQLDAWYDEGMITFEKRNQFHKEARLTWKRIHQKNHLKTRDNSSLDNENAIECFYAVMNEKLHILSTELGLELSNGEFINLANESKIGWKYKWKKEYYSGDPHI